MPQVKDIIVRCYVLYLGDVDVLIPSLLSAYCPPQPVNPVRTVLGKSIICSRCPSFPNNVGRGGGIIWGFEGCIPQTRESCLTCRVGASKLDSGDGFEMEDYRVEVSRRYSDR